MRLDVRWFFFGMLRDEYIDRDSCDEIIRNLNADADLETAAKYVVDIAYQNMGEADAKNFADAIKQMATYAAAETAAGKQPPELETGIVVERKIHVAKAGASHHAAAPAAKPAAPAAGATKTATAIDEPGIGSAPAATPTPARAPIRVARAVSTGEATSSGTAHAKPVSAATEASASPAPTPTPARAPIRVARAVSPGEAPASSSVASATPVPAAPAAAKPASAPAAAPAQSTLSPKLFSKPVTEGWEGMPDFEKVKSLSDSDLKEFVFGLLKEVRKRGASDLHLSSLSNPFVRQGGVNKCISNHILTAEEAERLNTVMLKEADMKSFKEDNDLNYLLAIDETNRFRVCLMQCKDGVAGSYRLVPARIRSLAELGFDEHRQKTIEHLLDYHNGLILVTGPIGSGKTTTLASLVDIVNSKRQDHVITVEDPIEIVQHSKNCNVTQREIRSHTNSYKTALKGALREDPDIIIIGELHDLETIEMAITASETGHLVIGTLHTCDAANTLNRLLDVFPPSQQAQIRTMTAGSLRGIVCQKLIPALDGTMAIALEIMVNNTATSNIISEGQTHMLRAVLQTGQKSGMCTMDASVLDLFKSGRISSEVASQNLRFSDAKIEYKKIYATQEARKLAKNMHAQQQGA